VTPGDARGGDTSLAIVRLPFGGRRVLLAASPPHCL